MRRSLPNNRNRTDVSRLQKRIFLALLVSLGLMLHVLEGFIPSPFPWMRLGLANLVSLLALYMFGFREAIFVAVLRILLASLLRGTLLSPIFFLSFGGGVMAVLAMGMMYRWGSRWFSVIGVSVWGALIFNITQVTVAYLVLVRHIEIFSLIPILLFTTPLSGVLTGIAAHVMLRRTEQYRMH
jgi:heptaprenyl diphosphate synthase